MFIAKKIITAAQMKVVKAIGGQGKENFVMKEFNKRGGAEILKNRKVYQKEFWKDLRAKSLERKKAGEYRGFTKDKLEEFFAEKINDKKDSFTNRQIKKIFTKVYGLKHARIVRKAAEMKREEKLHEHQNSPQIQENKQREIESRNHISELISNGHKKAQAGIKSFLVAPVRHENVRHAELDHANREFGHENASERLPMNENNEGIEERNVIQLDRFQSPANDSNIRTPYIFKGSKSEDVDGDVEKTKARLARIQEENNENDEEERLAA